MPHWLCAAGGGSEAVGVAATAEGESVVKIGEIRKKTNYCKATFFMREIYVNYVSKVLVT